MALPISTVAVAHAHLVPILEALKVEDAEVVYTTQITPPEDDKAYNPKTTYLVFTAGPHSVTVTVRSDVDVPRFRSANKPEDYKLKGYYVVVEGAGRSRIPLKQDGTFSYKIIAERIGKKMREHRRFAEEHARRQERSADHGEAVARLSERLRTSAASGWVHINEKATGGPISLHIYQFGRNVAPEAAEELVDFLSGWLDRNKD